MKSFLARVFLKMLMYFVVQKRDPDFIIGGSDNPYLSRWWLISNENSRTRWISRFWKGKVYLHYFMRSDDDRALHDHPWWNASLLLDGNYTEVTPEGRFHRVPGAFYCRPAEAAHRVELIRDINGKELPVWTLFITGPKSREWGFLCPQGWRHWRQFTNPKDNGATVGPGCE